MYERCLRCPLGEYREANSYHIVWGSGNLCSRILILGEAPGESEAKSGIPFIGRSGQFLRKKLNCYFNVERDAYILNTVLCRPPENRQPVQAERESCYPHIMPVFFRMQPKLIITAGKVASEWMSEFTVMPFEIYELTIAEVENIPFAWLPLYHPSYVMRTKEQTERFEKVLESYSKLFKGVDKL